MLLLASEMMKAPTLAEPSFIGRKNELSELVHFLDSMVKGEGSTIFISGEAGSGKTRLSKEFLDTAKNRGVAVLAGWCLSNAAVPYFPFIEAFGSLDNKNKELKKVLGRQELTIMTKLLGASVFEESTGSQFLSPQVWKDQMFTLITKELLNLSTIKPTILFIDDIHWADSASLALLHYIARAISSERLLVLATFRSEEIAGSVDGQLQPLSEALRLMGRESLFTEIKLSNLNQTEVNMVAEDMLGGSLSTVIAEKLYQESQGNPLFVVESLRMMYNQGSLIQENGHWNLVKKDLDFPQKVKDVILRRLNALKPDQRRILDIASVIGEKFDPKLVSSVIAESNMNVLEALSDIAQSTLLVYNEDDCYRFKHAKIQEMLYQKIDRLLRKEYHLRIANSLEELNVIVPPSSDIAHHFALAGNIQKAIKYSLTAGKDALAISSNVEAIKHFSYVLQFIRKSESNSEYETALEGLGDAYFANCMFENAIREYDKLAQSISPDVKLRALRKEMDTIWFKELDSSRIAELIKRAEPLASVNRLENARVRWNKGRMNIWKGIEEMKQALADHEGALQVFEEEFALADVASAVWPVGILRIMVGLEEARGVGELLRGISLLHELGDIHGEVLAYRIGAIDCFCLVGLIEEGTGFIKNVLDLGKKIGDFDSLSFAWLRLSDYQASAGDFSQAILSCQTALECAKKTDSRGRECLIYATLTRLHAIQGDIKKAEECLNEMRKSPQEVQKMPNNYVHVSWAEAFVLASKNKLNESYQELNLGNETLRRTYPNNAFTEFWIKLIYSEFLSMLGKTEEAKQQIMEVKELVDNGEKRFECIRVFAALMAPTHLEANQTFDIRLDLVNVSRSQGSIIRVDNLLIPQLEIVSLCPACAIRNGYIEFSENLINPLQVRTLKLSAKFSKEGNYIFQPIVRYSGQSGSTASCKARAISITVQPVQAQTSELSSEQERLRLASVSAQKAFSYLAKAYHEDILTRMLSEDQAGWRSLMQIVREGQVSKHNIYGQMGYGGKTVSELMRLKLVESRFFKGQRGRGGKIFKLRIFKRLSRQN